jgi:NAD(P)-dependent dehydrogenase (short-subunit alcohol dehydrogenase family)
VRLASTLSSEVSRGNCGEPYYPALPLWAEAPDGRSLAVEWAQQNIRVNAVSPGSVETEMLANLVRTGFGSADTFLSRIPMGRFGRPGEIADAVAYLASDRASYITGAVLPVDGGWLANGAPSER